LARDRRSSTCRSRCTDESEQPPCDLRLLQSPFKVHAWCRFTSLFSVLRIYAWDVAYTLHNICLLFS
jgi:hypothetical protein